MAKYVGRRIVPAHGGIWNLAKEYEELTIVLEESSGDSFISRRPVPAGTAISEEHYWMLYSKYSEQIERAEKHLDETASAIRSEMNTQKQQVTERMEQAEETVDERAAAAEKVSNDNRAAIESRMENIEARQEANVKASTDASADYAAELVDARVGADDKTHASAGAHLRAVESRLTSDIDQVRHSLNWYPAFEFGAINTITGGESITHFRMKSEMMSTDFATRLVVNEGYEVLICYYDAEKTFVSATGWKTCGRAVEIDSGNPYIRLLARHAGDDNEGVEFYDTENVWCYVFDVKNNLRVYAEQKAKDSQDARVRRLFDRLISTTSYEVTDASDRTISNTARWFIPCEIPEKSYIDTACIMLERMDSTGTIEVWEYSDDRTEFALLKTVPFSAYKNEPLDVVIDCFTGKGGYVSVHTDVSAVIGLDDGAPSEIAYTKDLESDRITIDSMSHIPGSFNAKLYAYQYGFSVTEEEEPVGLVYTIGEHDNVAEIIIEAMKTKDSIVYIEPYTHDCIAEWEAFFGSGYWANLSSGRGIELQNGIHIIGRSGCLLTCHYKGSNDYIQSDFSLFNNPAGGSGYTIENVAFEVSKIRYVIHDERGGDGTPYRVRYSRCRMSQDNSESTWDHSRACIGGGLGLHGDVVVEDCIFATVTSKANMDSLAYHNSGAAGAQNSLVIKNCYCEGDSTLQIASYGASSLQSKVLIANNSFGSAIEELHWDGAPGNFDIFYINNEIRSMAA